MATDFDPAHLSPSYFDEPIAALSHRIALLQEEIKRAEALLEWWKEGRAKFVGAKSVEHARSAPAPEPYDAPRTLRQTVLRVFLDHPTHGGGERLWSPAEVIAELERRGWMPHSDKGHAPAIVRSMLRDMAKRGQLERPDYGRFALASGARDRGEDALLRASKSPGVTQKAIMDSVAHLDQPTPTEIIRFLKSRGESPVRGSIHNALARLIDDGALVKVGDGRYELASRNGTEHASANGSVQGPLTEAPSVAPGGYERQSALTPADGSE